MMLSVRNKPLTRSHAFWLEQCLGVTCFIALVACGCSVEQKAAGVFCSGALL